MFWDLDHNDDENVHYNVYIVIKNIGPQENSLYIALNILHKYFYLLKLNFD